MKFRNPFNSWITSAKEPKDWFISNGIIARNKNRVRADRPLLLLFFHVLSRSFFCRSFANKWIVILCSLATLPLLAPPHRWIECTLRGSVLIWMDDNQRSADPDFIDCPMEPCTHKWDLWPANFSMQMQFYMVAARQQRNGNNFLLNCQYTMSEMTIWAAHEMAQDNGARWIMELSGSWVWWTGDGIDRTELGWIKFGRAFSGRVTQFQALARLLLSYFLAKVGSMEI